MIQPRATLSKVVPYTPGKSIQQVQAEVGVAHIIKLASNENPWGSPVSADELAEIIQTIALYPDIGSGSLLGQLSQKLGVSIPQLILGNGSDEILTMIGMAYLNPGDRVITARETFSEYGFVSHLMDATLEQVPLHDHTFDLDAIAAAVNRSSEYHAKMVCIANPNNPTGTIISEESLARFMSQIPDTVAVILDEAYAEFVDDPTYPNSIQLLSRYPNLIVTRTFSKLYGLAGFRIGYAIAAPEVIATLYKVRQPFNINSVALGAASVALDKSEFVEKTLTNNRTERQRLANELSLLGYTVIPSQANFLCIYIGPSAGEWVQALLRQGIIVRHLASFGMPEYVRITVGVPEQNNRLLALATRLKN